MSAAVLQALVEALLVSSGAIVSVLLVRPSWRRLFGPSAGLALWAAVPAATLAIAVPARVIIASTPESGAWSGPLTGFVPADGQPFAGTTHVVVLAAWLLGIVATAFLHASAQYRLLRQLAPVRHHHGRVHRSASSRFGAMAIGVLRPRIVVPADFESRYTTQQRELILLHEQSHLARGDLLADFVTAVYRCVFWFNPLVHYAARCLFHDQEMASDAAVVRARPHLRALYAHTLLDDHLEAAPVTVARSWGRKPIEERITMLRMPTKSRFNRSIGIVFAAAAASITAAGAWAAQPPRVESGAAEWSSSPVSIVGEDRTLRQAVEQLASAAGVELSGAELLDEARPGASLDYSFVEIPAEVALQIMMEEAPGVVFAFEHRGIRFAAKE